MSGLSAGAVRRLAALGFTLVAGGVRVLHLAQALVVWAGADYVTEVLPAVRGAGWAVWVFSGPSAEEPLVRRRPADHREWVEGLTSASFRITSGTGPELFAAYRKA